MGVLSRMPLRENPSEAYLKQRMIQSDKYLPQTSSFPMYFIHHKSWFLPATGKKDRTSLFQGSTHPLSLSLDKIVQNRLSNLFRQSI